MKIERQIETYIRECLLVNVQLTKPSKKQIDTLPMIISGAFELMVAELYNKHIVFAQDKTGTYSPVQLRKVANLLGEKWEVNCVFVYEQISGYNQTRMIQQGLNFIVVGKLMYMPELLIDMRPIRNAYDQRQKMPPTAQMIVLYHLERELIVEQQIGDIAERMHVSYATCNKAISWLRGHGLAHETKDGKWKLISLDANKREVWVKSLEYMYSPVEKVLYAAQETGMLSGYNALAHYTHLVRTDERVYAWFGKIPATFSQEENAVQIQIWRYDPEVLSEDGVVDPLSLYLTLREDKDERVSLEMEEMVNKVMENGYRKWKE